MRRRSRSRSPGKATRASSRSRSKERKSSTTPHKSKLGAVLSRGPGKKTRKYPFCPGPYCWCKDCARDTVDDKKNMKRHAELMLQCATEKRAWKDEIQSYREKVMQWMISHPYEVTISMDVDASAKDVRLLPYRGALKCHKGCFFWDTGTWVFVPSTDFHPEASFAEGKNLQDGVHFGRPPYGADRDWSTSGPDHDVITAATFREKWEMPSSEHLAFLNNTQPGACDGSSKVASQFAMLRACGYFKSEAKSAANEASS